VLNWKLNAIYNILITIVTIILISLDYALYQLSDIWHNLICIWCVYVFINSFKFSGLQLCDCYLISTFISFISIGIQSKDHKLVTKLHARNISFGRRNISHLEKDIMQSLSLLHILSGGLFLTLPSARPFPKLLFGLVFYFS